jgi:hypothetical protein
MDQKVGVRIPAQGAARQKCHLKAARPAGPCRPGVGAPPITAAAAAYSAPWAYGAAYRARQVNSAISTEEVTVPFAFTV